MPCEWMSLDVMDVSGDMHLDVVRSTRPPHPPPVQSLHAVCSAQPLQFGLCLSFAAWIPRSDRDPHGPSFLRIWLAWAGLGYWYRQLEPWTRANDSDASTPACIAHVSLSGFAAFRSIRSGLLPCSSQGLHMLTFCCFRYLQDHDIFKKRLGQDGKPINSIGDKHKVGPEIRDPDSNDTVGCGSCYGAQSPEQECCNTCDEVRSPVLMASSVRLCLATCNEGSSEAWAPLLLHH